jgi:hypothetical protein
MEPAQTKTWHFAQWPALGWLETVIKLFALGIGIGAGIGALSAGTWQLPNGWLLAAWIVLVLLALGLVAAIADRWTDKEILAMGFVFLNNLGHWGMVLSLVTPNRSTASLLAFSGLMLAGDLVKVWFIRRHNFTVREYSGKVLIQLTAVYITGYILIILAGLLA